MKNHSEAVKEYWEDESCGERYASTDSDQYEFYQSETNTRYSLEPFILDFGKFYTCTDKTVLEIGVGMGSDHSRIAQSLPKRLVGIDLTKRSIEHTRKRFFLLDLNSELLVQDTEKLSFPDNTFDIVYSWGVLHHCFNTVKAVNEMLRVLKKGGEARLMIYHKYSVTGLMLWLRYGLFSGQLFKTLNQVYAEQLESPGTTAYSIREAKDLFRRFSTCRLHIQLSHGDLLLGQVGKKHQGKLLKLAKVLWPVRLLRVLNMLIPVGLFLMVEVRK